MNRAHTLDERLAALEACWQMWHEVLAGLHGDDWTAPTRATGWDVKSLATHHAGWVLGFAAIGDHVVAPPPATTTTAAELLRRFNAPEGAAQVGAADIERATREFAATITEGQLVAAFAAVAPGAVAGARDLGPVVVDYLGQAEMDVEEVVLIGLLEASVHGLDLLAALDHPVERLPGDARDLTAGLLVDVADPIAFIEAATGRRAGVLPVVR